MKNEPNFEIFRQAFSLRIKATSALADSLKPKSDNLGSLGEACHELEDVIAGLEQGDVEDEYRAFYTATAIFLLLAKWKHATRNAEPDAQRFVVSAKLKAAEVDKSLSFTANEQLIAFLDYVVTIENLDDLDAAQAQLREWTLPLLLFANRRTQAQGAIRVPASQKMAEESESLETSVAFLKFDIDGKPAKKMNYLTPGTSYDLTIEVRVSNWPRTAATLSLSPVTIDIRERDWLPSFKFEKPVGDGPFTFTGTGRAVLEIAHSFGSRPYEFLYAAEFDDTSSCRSIEVIGHRRLLLEGSDVTSNPLSGFSHVDQHLIKVRNNLRTFPGLHPDDVTHAMTLLGGLGNIAAQALKSNLFASGTLEDQFQREVAQMLRNRSDIGEHLEEHPAAAGGITDLTFYGLPLELKVDNTKARQPKDYSKFFDQTAAYAIGLGKRIGILSVLESSKKTSPASVIEDDIELFVHQVGQSSIIIVVVIVRGGFPKPSSYSR